MKLSQLKQLLESNATASLQFRLPTGEMVPNHFHVTEVGLVTKDFIDCGGVRRQTRSCVLQLWTASDVDHRLKSGKLDGILQLAAPVLGSEDLEVEVEHGERLVSLYRLDHAVASFGTVQLVLAGKQTDCLAKEKCGIEGSQAACC